MPGPLQDDVVGAGVRCGALAAAAWAVPAALRDAAALWAVGDAATALTRAGATLGRLSLLLLVGGALGGGVGLLLRRRFSTEAAPASLSGALVAALTFGAAALLLAPWLVVPVDGLGPLQRALGALLSVGAALELSRGAVALWRARRSTPP